MTELTDDPVCLCGDPKSEHRLGRKGCKALDCGCGEFEAAELATGGILTGPPITLPAGCVIEPSTSPRLREVERELADTNAAFEALKAELTAARREMADLQKNEEIRAQVIRERNEERKQLRARVAELEALLVHAEQYARDLQDNGDVAPVEIHGWDAWQCFTCGNRYRRDFDHEHGPLKPVRVSITER